MHQINMNNRSITQVVKTMYDFDMKLEINIYRYVCYYNYDRKVL